jgi:hypothetical protein
MNIDFNLQINLKFIMIINLFINFIRFREKSILILLYNIDFIQ